jgi:hypothetical protein
MKLALVFMLVIAPVVPAVAQTQATPLRDAANRAAVQLAGSVDASTVQAAQVRQPGWAARHPALTGALVGLGIGFPIGVATCRYPTAEASSCASYTYPGNARLLGGVTIGLLGAGIGAGVGALIGAVH